MLRSGKHGNQKKQVLILLKQRGCWSRNEICAQHPLVDVIINNYAKCKTYDITCTATLSFVHNFVLPPQSTSVNIYSRF